MATLCGNLKVKGISFQEVVEVHLHLSQTLRLLMLSLRRNDDMNRHCIELLLFIYCVSGYSFFFVMDVCPCICAVWSAYRVGLVVNLSL